MGCNGVQMEHQQHAYSRSWLLAGASPSLRQSCNGYHSCCRTTVHLLYAFPRLSQELRRCEALPSQYCDSPALRTPSTSCLSCCRGLAQSPPMPLAPALQDAPWGAQPPTSWGAATCRQAAVALRLSQVWTRAQAARAPTQEPLVLTLPIQPRLAQVGLVHEPVVFPVHFRPSTDGSRAGPISCSSLLLLPAL